MRIQRFIALNSVYSRRKAEELIELGKVKLNDKTITSKGVLVDPLNETIKVNDKEIIPIKKCSYIMLNKPAGYTTTKHDINAKKTIMDIIPYKSLHPVGRLDKQTEGLLLLTDDGDVTYKLTHPKFEHEKEYFVIVKKPITTEIKQKLERGILLDNEKTAPAVIKNIKQYNKKWSCNIIIHEGKNRQIRRMFEEIRNPVVYLKRVRISGLKLGNLKLGEYRELTNEEIESITK